MTAFARGWPVAVQEGSRQDRHAATRHHKPQQQPQGYPPCRGPLLLPCVMPL